MNTKEQYTMKKNPETQTITPNFKFSIVKHYVPLFHQTLPKQNNCTKTPSYATFIRASHTHYTNLYWKMCSCNLLNFCKQCVLAKQVSTCYVYHECYRPFRYLEEGMAHYIAYTAQNSC